MAQLGQITLRDAVAKSLRISQSRLRNWLARTDIDDGRRDCLTSSERAELVELRRKVRRLELENEILRKAAAYFAREERPSKAGDSRSATPPVDVQTRRLR